MTDQLGDDVGGTSRPPTTAAALPHPRRGARLGLVVGVIVLVAGLGVAIVAGREAAQAADEVRDIRSGDRAPLDLGHHHLITALQTERNVAATYMLGVDDVLVQPVSDNDDARALTDGALADLRARVEEQRAVVADAYASAVDGLADLPDLRARVDATSVGDRSMGNADLADAVFDEYSAHIDALFDASTESLLAATDDPFTRRGLILVDLGSEHGELTALLRRALLLASLDGGLDSADESAGVAAHLTTLRDIEAAIEEQATGDFQVHADALLAGAESRRLQKVADDALATGRVDADEAMTSVTIGDPAAGDAFRAGVTEVIGGRRHDLESAATTRQWRATLLAVAAFVTAIAALVLVAMAAGAVARSRAARPHPWPTM